MTGPKIKPHNWTINNVEQLRRLLSYACSKKEIASNMGLSISQINNAIVRYIKCDKMPSPELRCVYWTDEERQMLKELRDRGVPRTEIAKKMNKTFSQVTNALHRIVNQLGPVNRTNQGIYTSIKNNPLCLKCRIPFASTGAGNRICPSCRRENNQTGSTIEAYAVHL